MASIAVADSSPIIRLCSVGQLSLFDALFEEVIVPLEVVQELSAKAESPEPKALADLKHIRFSHPRGPMPRWVAGLDSGERHAIAIAVEYPGAVVLLDEKRARRVAKGAGLQVQGTLGILVESKRRGLVRELKPILVGLRNGGAYLSDSLCNEVLRSVGEAPLEPRP